MDAHPSQHPELHHITDTLIDFVGNSTHWNSASLLSAIALDLSYHEAFYANERHDFDGSTLSPEQIQALLAQPLPFIDAHYLHTDQYSDMEARLSALAGESTDDDPPLQPVASDLYWAVYRSSSGGVQQEMLSRVQWLLLTALKDNQALPQAIEYVMASDHGFASAEELGQHLGEHIQTWFFRWGRLGWLAAV